jgi:Peptidase S24-like
LASSGTLRLRVTGWSMLPTVWPGDTLLIERVNSEVVSEGDIVLFGRDRRLFVHRVVRKITEDSKILTRGDAMPRLDPPVLDRDLMGKVVLIQREGRYIRPKSSLSLSSRAVAAAVRRSETAARVVVPRRIARNRSRGPEFRPQICSQQSERRRTSFRLRQARFSRYQLSRSRLWLAPRLEPFAPADST